MFITDPWMQDRLSRLDGSVREATKGAVRFEEHIALPAFGQIVARFQTNDPVTVDQVDAWERQLYGLAGDDYLIDFMGDVYRQLGVDYAQLDEIIEKLGKRFEDEPLHDGPYAKNIRSDARELLLRCGLPEDQAVWEIQWEDGEYSLLLMGRENRYIRTVAGEPPIHLMEANDILCEGLIRATFAARRLGLSLGRLMLEAMEEGKRCKPKV